jgi:hypothetical protein
MGTEKRQKIPCKRKRISCLTIEIKENKNQTEYKTIKR